MATELSPDTIPQPPREAGRAFERLWVIEDDAQTRRRQGVPGVLPRKHRVLVQLHSVRSGEAATQASAAYKPGDLGTGGRTAVALALLDRVHPRRGVLLAGTNYGANPALVSGALDLGLEVALEVHRSSRWTPEASGSTPVRADALLQRAAWTPLQVVSPEIDDAVQFHAADLGIVSHHREQLRAIAYAPGSVTDPQGDVRIAVTSLTSAHVRDLVQCLGWIRWIRTLNRRQARDANVMSTNPATLELPRRRLLVSTSRPNIRLAREHDVKLTIETDPRQARAARTAVATRNVMELFAGAGGLGLGFLLASSDNNPYKLVYSAEVDPTYVQTLRQNHQHLSVLGTKHVAPAELQPLDLRSIESQQFLLDVVERSGGIDLLIGGPPCQGFSNANRNSWSARNPNNRLVDVFLRCVRKLQPRIALLENVQGILWTDRQDSTTRLSVAAHVVNSLRRAGYWAFPKLLDAVWFGVPQHRARFFLLALHEDLGYEPSDFGQWGPFPVPTHGPATPHPYTTVAQAISDLPSLDNGQSEDVLEYREPPAAALKANPYLSYLRHGAEDDVITDHVTSRHAAYVLDRYRKIPEGGNWRDIATLMSNYTDVERTHSNIYRRLRWSEPAVTIGHYRKSMIVHPSQHRGLSLREAARLQSFPDWFRFAGTSDGSAGGLMHKQQQLANAVSPLVARAIAEYLLHV